MKDRLPRKKPKCPSSSAQAATSMGRRAQSGSSRKRARDLEAVDHAERAVEPAGVVLRLRVRSDAAACGPARGPAEHVADPVDRGFQSRFRKLLGEPQARLHVLRAKRSADERPSCTRRIPPSGAGRRSGARRRLSAWIETSVQVGLTARMSLPATCREASRSEHRARLRRRGTSLRSEP